MKASTTAMALVVAATAAPAMAQTEADIVGTVQVGEIVPLPDWRVDELYPGGMSAEEMIDELDVYGPGGDEIGDVDDLIISAEGDVIAVIAEIGGFLDIGDTHVSIPWSEVVFTADGISVPITEDTIEDYGLFGSPAATASVLSEEIVSNMDDRVLGPRAWRVTELIGDYARLRTDEAAYRNYGYVSDVIIRDGRVAAAVVSPDAGYGVPGRRYPYPYYGFGYNWTPGANTYDLPYDDNEIGAVEPLEYERFQTVE